LTTPNFKLKEIKAQIITQLQNIDGGSNYNNKLPHANIFSGFKSFETVNSYPTVCVGYIAEPDSIPTDQRTYECDITSELYAYTKNSLNPLDYILDFCEDIQTCLLEDPSLNSLIYQLSLSYEITSMEDLGVAVITLKAKTEWTNS